MTFASLDENHLKFDDNFEVMFDFARKKRKNSNFAV